MKITYKGDYALKALFYLTYRYEQDKEDVVSIAEIAKIGDMPKKFLEQILLVLRKGGFVKSRRGVEGGFSLARPPKNITVGDVIRFIEGPIEPIACVEKEGYKGCSDVGGCIFRDVWKEVTGAISAVIDTLNFEELLLRYKNRQFDHSRSYDYMI